MVSKKQTPNVTQDISGDRNIIVPGDAQGVFISGDNNTVNQTIIQKVFNVFRGDGETLDQRNRRILLNHVENFWVKGVLEKSLYGEVLIELGMKEEPDAVKTYPWDIQRESTGETLPDGMTMLEIFNQVGLGRSLLILGAPGSGKTTMLLELARQLIARARQDASEPIPIIFNLSSWTESKTLAQWLIEQLNLIYYVPKKTAPDWIYENKLLLLLDGFDEMRAESRTKCVDAINAFRKEHGLTSLVICSRSEDYADTKTKLNFEGAIEVQQLRQDQIADFFNHFGDEMTGIQQSFEKDTSLKEMAKTPLFLNIMVVVHQNKRNIESLALGDEKAQRKHLLDMYIKQMFDRPRTKNTTFKRQDVLRWLSWLATRMVEHNTIPYLLEDMQPSWLEIQPIWLKEGKKIWQYRIIVGLLIGLFPSLMFGAWAALIISLIGYSVYGIACGVGIGVMFGLLFGFIISFNDIKTVDALTWDWSRIKDRMIYVVIIYSLICGLISGPLLEKVVGFHTIVGSSIGFFGSLLTNIGFLGITQKSLTKDTYPRQRIYNSLKNFFFTAFLFVMLYGLVILVFASTVILFGVTAPIIKNSVLSSNGIPLSISSDLLLLISGTAMFLLIGIIGGLQFGGLAVIQHYILCFMMIRENLLPRKTVLFLEHCVDLIFLRRVGGGYIFVHRLLMEHFAEMYKE